MVKEVSRKMEHMEGANRKEEVVFIDYPGIWWSYTLQFGESVRYL